MWYLLFVTNAIHCFLKNKPLYGLSFLFLTCTSIVFWEFNSDESSLKYWIDQIGIYIVVLFGAINLSLGQYIYPILSTFIGVVLIHCYDLYTEDSWLHPLIHILSSVGHHLILQNF